MGALAERARPRARQRRAVVPVGVGRVRPRATAGAMLREQLLPVPLQRRVLPRVQVLLPRAESPRGSRLAHWGCSSGRKAPRTPHSSAAKLPLTEVAKDHWLAETSRRSRPTRSRPRGRCPRHMCRYSASQHLPVASVQRRTTGVRHKPDVAESTSVQRPHDLHDLIIGNRPIGSQEHFVVRPLGCDGT